MHLPPAQHLVLNLGILLISEGVLSGVERILLLMLLLSIMGAGLGLEIVLVRCLHFCWFFDDLDVRVREEERICRRESGSTDFLSH